MTIALAGNPNSGKTTLFNALTGMNLKVGNWPGVTVERKEGVFSLNREEAHLVDLPGVYSLRVYSIEEKVTREYVDSSSCDVILNIVDASCLERSLYLTHQLLERGLKVVLALNMMDQLEKRGVKLDADRLGSLLGVRAVPISAREGKGMEELKQALIAGAESGDIPRDPVLQYSDALRAAFFALGKRGGRKAALDILEGECQTDDGQRDEIQKLEAACGTDAFSELAAARYRRIEEILKALSLPLGPKRFTFSDRIDRVLMRPALALPLFAAAMALLFTLTFGLPGEALRGWMERVIALAGEGANRLLTAGHAPEWARSLLIDGVIAGVGSVLCFLPQMLTLFGTMALLEESGCMARAAFLTDCPLRALGLSGRSFIPLLMGFGCTATAAMAARTVESDADRKKTVLLTPFLSCGAKLPVYALFASAFFPGKKGLLAAFLYGLGILVMTLCAFLLRKRLFRGEPAGFVMELPEYRLPALKSVWKSLCQRGEDFLARAGTVIFAMSVAVWFLNRYTPNLTRAAYMEDSMLGRMGGMLGLLLRPLGFGSPACGGALVAGLAAKEAVVSSLRIAFGAQSTGELAARLSGMMDAPSAMAFLTFVLLYPPCVSALAVMRRELGSARLTALSVILQTVCAYGCALLVRGAMSLIL